MYKLVVIGGKIRGSEFELESGENTLGRDPECNIHLEVEGVSKKHLRITVNEDTAYLEDLGSSNGTFVNGKLVKKTTVVSGDKIALPNVIIQVVYVHEKKVIIKKKVLKEDEDSEEDVLAEPPIPDHPLGKALHIFKYKVMPTLYSFNKEYEWHAVVAILMAVFVFLAVSITLLPVFDKNKRILLKEIRARGYHYTEDIQKLNYQALSRKALEDVNAKFLDEESGIESYELFDIEGRIFAPINKMNEFTNDTWSIEAKEIVSKQIKNKERIGEPFIIPIDGGFGIGRAITASTETSDREVVGIIAIKFSPLSLLKEESNKSKAFLEGLFLSTLVGAIFFGMIYFLTIRTIEDVRFQADQVLRGKQKEIENRYLFKEFKGIRDTINALLHKVSDAQGDEGGDFAEMEDDSKYVGILKEFLSGCSGPGIVLNSEKLIQEINLEAEDLTGIRQSIGEGAGLLDVAKDQGFAATVIDLCDQSANADGVCQKGNYELSGVEYDVCINALMGKDNFAKAFLVTFIKSD